MITAKELEKELQDKQQIFNKMKSRIIKNGGLFYQYRACRDDGVAIYDINNILNGVIFSRSPLYMNDPFDSMIGFSSQKIYEECISLAMEKSSTPVNVRPLVLLLLKNQFLNQMNVFLRDINELKKKILMHRASLHQNHIDLATFSLQQGNTIFRKYYKKSQYEYAAFLLLCALIGEAKTDVIAEDDILKFLDMEKHLACLREQIEIIKNVYLNAFTEFLSKIGISCMTESGWDNTLMWAHYANSYSGICIEYDLHELKEFDGLLYPVIYSAERPVISLNDFGLVDQLLGKEQTEVSNESTARLITYLLVKGLDWKYEQEWRFLGFSDKEYGIKTPFFPYVKSITLGAKLNPMHKDLIIDVCKQKQIACYELVLGTDDFSIKRKEIDVFSHCNNFEQGGKYIDFLSKKLVSMFERVASDTDHYCEQLKEGILNVEYLEKSLVGHNETICLMQFIKQANNLYYGNYSLETTTQEQLLKFDNDMSAFLNNNLPNLSMDVMYFFEKKKISAVQCKTLLQKILVLNEILPNYLAEDWKFY